MSAGVLDQRITFQANTPVSDGMGGNVNAWANLPDTPTVWAGVTPVSGNEGTDEGGTSATGLYLFEVRRRTDINEVDRVVWNGENYNIRKINRTSQRDLNVKFVAERGVAT